MNMYCHKKLFCMKVTKNNEIYTACPKISSTFLEVFKTIRQKRLLYNVSS